MIKELAVNHFTGKNGYRRLNCAQTILQIFIDKFDFVTEERISEFKKMGAGKAPLGECGMVYAAKFILHNSGRDTEIAGFENFFSDFAGSLKCSEINKKKREFCTLCIKETAEYLDKILQ
ncbi:MAG TPA: hypothetical protein PKG60_00665 [Spirochaetota bacterium]|nr:hypothetical protein [Spirochaetota bacterium]HPS86136.1 hypothetical protein [Spirochaetota bacterium]